MVKVIIKQLEWDDWNISHIARHKVIPSEIEEVCGHNVVKLQSRLNRIILIGKTKTKRVLKIVLESKKQQIWRPVTAHDASRKERKFYKEEIGGEK